MSAPWFKTAQSIFGEYVCVCFFVCVRLVTSLLYQYLCETKCLYVFVQITTSLTRKSLLSGVISLEKQLSSTRFPSLCMCVCVCLCVWVWLNVLGTHNVMYISDSVNSIISATQWRTHLIYARWWADGILKPLTIPRTHTNTHVHTLSVSDPVFLWHSKPQ